jgi:hypothetical protein
MSEYQYYEWQTIDRPLTVEEQAAVNGLSSHIDVTSTRAVVTYNWGDFKHDPTEVLVKYFDAFMYHFNWGSSRLLFRFPKNMLDVAQINPYLWEYNVELEPAGEYLILSIAPDDENDYGDYERDTPLSTLASVRDDILNGDFRALYLAWLRAAELADIDEEVEPPVPAGLKNLSASLAAFMRFFAIDPFLVEAGAQASPPDRATPSVPAEELLVRLPEAERDAFLLRLARGEPHLSMLLNRRLRELAGKPAAPVRANTRRTWGDLRDTAARLQKEAERREREAAEARRIQELKDFAPRAAKAWGDVDALIQQKTASAYDQAVALLVKLRDLAIYQDRLPEFQARLDVLQAQYAKRPALLARLQRVTAAR